MVISEDPWPSHLLLRVWQWGCHYTCFYDSGLLRLGFGHPTFHLRDERSNSLPHRRDNKILNMLVFLCLFSMWKINWSVCTHEFYMPILWSKRYFVCLGYSFHSISFSSYYQWRAANLFIALIQQRAFFSSPHLLWNETSVYMDNGEDPQHLHLLRAFASMYSCNYPRFNHLGLI